MMEELDIKESQLSLPLKSWIKIIALAVILLAFILGMFDLMKWHH